MRAYKIVGFVSLCALSIAMCPAAQQPNEPDEKPPAILNKPARINPKDDELSKLLKERYNAAMSEAADVFQVFLSGQVGVEPMFQSGQRLLKSGLEFHEASPAKITFLKDYLELAKAVEMLHEVKFGVGKIPPREYHAAVFFRLDAEIQLLRAKRQAEKSKDK